MERAAASRAQRGELLWEPSPDTVEGSQMTAYMRWLAAERGVEVDGYEALWRWSVSELEDFWASIWDYFEVASSTPYAQVLPERTMPGARWFEGAVLNYAEHVLRVGDDGALAVQHAAEGGERRGARIRAPPLRPPAVGALLLRHDRSAEGDRPRPRRDPPRAPQEAQPARRPPR